MEDSVKNLVYDPALAGIHKEWLDFFAAGGLLTDFEAAIVRICAAGAETIVNLCPEPKNILAFAKFPLSSAKIVLIGQDPYLHRDQAMGLAFSVPSSIKLPPSLVNIFSMLTKQGLMAKPTKCGDLTGWCEQGVILLNTALTTVEGESAAHVDQWMPFTKKLISKLSAEVPLIFILLGGSASKLKANISRKSMIFEWGHPSPLNMVNKDPSNPKNFAFCTAFKLANNTLEQQGKQQIDWGRTCTACASASASTSAAPAIPQDARVIGTLKRSRIDTRSSLFDPRDDMHVCCFVDGAASRNGKKDASGGFAVTIVFGLDLFTIVGKLRASEGAPTPTNNRAELMALRDAFVFMASPEFIAEFGSIPLDMFYDSQYAKGCVCVWYESWCKMPPSAVRHNLDIISVANDYFKRVEAARKIEWFKVESHQREPEMQDTLESQREWYAWSGNQYVDELAREAVNDDEAATSASAK